MNPNETYNSLRNHGNQQQQQQLLPGSVLSSHLPSGSSQLDIHRHVTTQHALLIGRLALAQRDVSVASAAAAIFDRYTRELAAVEAKQDELMRLYSSSHITNITGSSSSNNNNAETQTLLAYQKIFDKHRLDLVERTANEWASLSPRATPTLAMTSPQTSSSDVTSEPANEMTSLRGKKKRKRGSLNPRALMLMDEWFKVNTHHPYPDDDVVDDLAEQGAISTYQVRKWMANRRVRQKLKSGADGWCITPCDSETN